MQTKLHCGVYIGPPVMGIKPGGLVEINEQIFVKPSGDVLTLWEVRLRAKKPGDAWVPVDRLDLVIPGHEAEADQLRMLLVVPRDTISSASRQHYIDTGEYLCGGEAIEA